MLHLSTRVRTAILSTLDTATAVDGGPTTEQSGLLGALASHVLQARPDAASVITPTDAAAVIEEPWLRRAVGEMLVTLELVRHPASAALTARVAEYLAAFQIEDGFQKLAVDYLMQDRELVQKDWERVRQTDFVEPFTEGLDADSLERKMDGLGDLPPDSLGYALFEFYRRNGFPWISHEDQSNLISHDLTHVLAGYATTPPGEIALQGFLVAATRGERYFSSLLASLLLFEVGMLPFPDIEPIENTLAQPEAAELFARAIERGLHCPGDIGEDHQRFLDKPLAQVRTELGIPEPEPGPHMFIP